MPEWKSPYSRHFRLPAFESAPGRNYRPARLTRARRPYPWWPRCTISAAETSRYQFATMIGRISEMRMKVNTVAILLAVGAWTVPVTCGSAARADELASHRAIYELRLGPGRNSGGITDVSGRMVTEWQEGCDDYTLNQRTVTFGRSADGEPVENDYSVSNWESRDGLTFRFDVRNLVNGEVQEEFSGKAELDGPGKAGRVSFRKPAGESLDLPEGTLFPTEHTKVLIARAAAGEKVVSRPLFDGSGTDGLFEAVAFVSTAIKVPGDDKIEGLRGQIGYPLRLAFFNIQERDALPAYEVGGALYANGVSGDLTIDYREFSLLGKLTGLDLLPKPGC